MVKNKKVKEIILSHWPTKTESIVSGLTSGQHISLVQNVKQCQLLSATSTNLQENINEYTPLVNPGQLGTQLFTPLSGQGLVMVQSRVKPAPEKKCKRIESTSTVVWTTSV